MKHIYWLPLVLSACGDPLVEPQEIIGTRALGLRLSLADDSSIMSVKPGDQAQIALLVVAPRQRRLSAVVSFCTSKQVTLGVPECQGRPFATESIEGMSGEDLVVPFVLSPQLKPGDEWLVRAAVCDDADAEGRTALIANCDDGEPPLELFYRAEAAGTEVNHNPNLGDDELRFNGKSWPEQDDVGEECDSSLPKLGTNSQATITFLLKGDDRERLPSGSDSPRESLLFSHAMNAPGLARAFSAIEQDTTSKSFELSLARETTSENAKSRVVTFHLVVRDGRGGSDWTSRQLCLDE